jgi:polyphosphate:AMP phosphotransferase
MLMDEGALILKFWFHLSKQQQRIRLKTLESDPKTRWRVTETDWKHFKIYDTFRTVSERALRQTSTADAPWRIVEGADANYRSLAVGKAILEALQQRLDCPPAPPDAPAAPLPSTPDDLNVLRSLDLSLSLEKKLYKKLLLKYQRKLNLLSRRPEFRGRSVIAVFEGNDAAGKGGTIRRVSSALDARQYVIIPTAAPTEEERAQPYLWRFWRHIPRQGKFAVFDRSWYGRVLVERVEGFCSEADWQRAYSEINDFEQQLVRHGAVVAKFWLSISKDEQLRRFEERQQTGFKHYKITDEDWRNREKWDLYEQAVADMVDRTSTEIAPWTLVPANDKRYARVKVLKTLCDRLEAALDQKG